MARELSLSGQAQGHPEEGDQSPDRLHHSGHDDDDDEEERGELEGEGELLYRDFLSRRLASEMDEMEVAQYRPVMFPHVRYPAGGRAPPYYHQTRPDLSSDFSTLAERFQSSRGRQEVRRRADMVDVSTLNQENLTQMLTELFQDGVTQERVLVLFFFCSDLTMRALREGLASLVSRLTDWVLSFIRTAVSCLVRWQGGWRSLLSSLASPWNFHHLAVVSLSAALLGLGLLYVKRQT